MFQAKSTSYIIFKTSIHALFHNTNRKENSITGPVTFTAPVLSSSTPTASRFNLFVLGALPAANSQDNNNQPLTRERTLAKRSRKIKTAPD